VGFTPGIFLEFVEEAGALHAHPDMAKADGVVGAEGTALGLCGGHQLINGGGAGAAKKSSSGKIAHDLPPGWEIVQGERGGRLAAADTPCCLCPSVFQGA
jgi:hypothetical protein